MQRGNGNGILMRGIGRWIVFSRLRAWLGLKLEVPRLLRDATIPRAATCLDIATGLGWGSVGLLRRDPLAEIVALDSDERILPHTRYYLSSHAEKERTAVCRGDAKHLPFRDGAFHVVICFYGLHHCRGYLEALREIARVLKPAGTLALIDPVRKAGKTLGGHHGTEIPTLSELRRMLSEAGFDPVAPRVSNVSRTSGGAQSAILRIVRQKRPKP
jgi:ubiquinone/menaquinone biosynthesis C-methylase UbiE